MTFPAEFYVHTATVEQYLGEGSMGPMYAAPVTVSGFLDTTAQDVRSAFSDEVTAARSMSFYTDPSNASLFVVQSRLTSSDLGGDGKATVVRVNALTSGPLGLPDHIEVGLL